MYFFTAYFLILAAVGQSHDDFRPLDDYILHHEDVSYDVSQLQSHHLRSKRSTDSEPISLEFTAFGRNFHLLLEKEDGIFARNHKLQIGNREVEDVDTSLIYKGVEKDTPSSKVFGSIINGIFRGSVDIPGDTTYHIEPANKYKKAPSTPCVIYRERDMNLDPYRRKRESSRLRGSCANDRVSKWMQKVTSSVVQRPISIINRAVRQMEMNNVAGSKYSEGYQHVIKKRAITNMEPKNTCELSMQADPLFYEYVQKNTQDGTTKSDQQTVDEILDFFASHVAKLNAIYAPTIFETTDGSFGYRGVNFVIQKSSMLSKTEAKCDTAEASPYCKAMDVSFLLNQFSDTDHSAFCLSYLITYRDFTEGTLGLAWVGSSTGSAGGICDPYREVNLGGTTSKKSLNTGLITTLNFNKPVPPTVSKLSLAHEIGHNFGAAHDTTKECAPYGTDHADAAKGNYIMFPSSNTGEKSHNLQFSSCSRDSIARVLKVVVDSQNNCFKQTESQYCGNRIVEAGEACDCGFEEDCKNTCCNPRGATGECQLKGSVVCSPDSGPCCNSTCQFVPLSSDQVCRSAGECSQESKCSAQCPSPTQSSEGTFCNDKKLVCKGGECIASICTKMNWQECYYTGDSTKMCYIACQKTATDECISSNDAEKVNQHTDFKNLLISIKGEVKGVELPAGSPCNSFAGFCTEFNVCKQLDSEGPLKRLTNLLLSADSWATVLAWMKEYWWAVGLITLGVILLLAGFIKCCGRSTAEEYAKRYGHSRNYEMDDRRKRSRSPDKYRSEQDHRQSRSRSPEKYRPDNRDDDRHRQRSSRYQENDRGSPRRDRGSRQSRPSRREQDNSFNIDRRGPPPAYSPYNQRPSQGHGYSRGYY